MCRLDLRGTGSSAGDATDEYPLVERTDLGTVIAWLAEQEWCNGNVGMFGTSYSGFNSLQVACERPPALKAICAIYCQRRPVDRRRALARLGAAAGRPGRLLPLHDADVPAAAGAGGVARRLARGVAAALEINEPWVLTWLRENRDGPYWRAGSVHGDGVGYDRIECPTLIVAGWADGYRNNSLPHRRGAAARPASRTGCSPGRGRTPTRRPRCRVRGSTSTSRWSPGSTGGCGAAADDVDRPGRPVFVRTSTVPEPDLDLHEGYWVSGAWPPVGGHVAACELDGPRCLAVEPDTGVAAWIDCAGHLPWGLSGDQREDDARSLTWDSEPRGRRSSASRGCGCASARTRPPPRCR